MHNIGVYPGTFDPITMGHVDIIKRSMNFCQELIIAIGVNSKKNTFFSEEERKDLILKTITSELGSKANNIRIESFSGLLVNFAKEQKANILIRGIRNVSDFEYEINLANINKTLEVGIETIFLPTSPELAVVSSSMVKEIAKYGGDISRFVSKAILRSTTECFSPSMKL